MPAAPDMAVRERVLEWARSPDPAHVPCPEAEDVATVIVWQSTMLDRARRVCTAAKRHADYMRQWPATKGLSPTLLELIASVDALAVP